MKTTKCKCNGCKPSNFLPILQRIKKCDCHICLRQENFPTLYFSCVELHFLYRLGYDKSIDSVRDQIQSIKDSYKRSKKIVLYYFYFRYILLRLLNEVRYRPGGSGYFKAMQNFYTYAKK